MIKKREIRRKETKIETDRIKALQAHDGNSALSRKILIAKSLSIASSNHDII